MLGIIHELIRRNTGVVDEDIDLEVGASVVRRKEGLGGIDDLGRCFGGGGEVCLDGGGLDLVGCREVFAELLGGGLGGGGGVGEEEVAALGGESLCYGGTDALGVSELISIQCSRKKNTSRATGHDTELAIVGSCAHHDEGLVKG